MKRRGKDRQGKKKSSHKQKEQSKFVLVTGISVGLQRATEKPSTCTDDISTFWCGAGCGFGKTKTKLASYRR
jgi:hypothetical protein